MTPQKLQTELDRIRQKRAKRMRTARNKRYQKRLRKRLNSAPGPGRILFKKPSEYPMTATTAPTLADARAFLLNSVSLQHKGCVGHYIKQPPPPAWKKSGLLRFHRVVRVDRAGISLEGEYALTVDPELGLVLSRPEDRDE